MEEAIRTRDLVKRFVGSAAVDGLSLTVPRRAIYGFLGRNGAGKTTTVRLLLGLLRPDAGEIALFGRPLAAARRAGEHVGALVEAPSLYDHLTGRENLDLSRRLLGLPAGEIDRVLAIVDLSSAARRRVGGYSLGMRQRLAIARALLGSPRLLILDEPTNGLDPEGIADMRRLLTTLPASGDVTIIVSSHLLDEVERVATHVGLIDRGQLVAEGALADLQSAATAMVEVDSDAGAAATLQAHGLEASGERGQLLVRSDTPERVAALLVGGGHPVHRLVRRGRRLEQLFADATMREAA